MQLRAIDSCWLAVAVACAACEAPEGAADVSAASAADTATQAEVETPRETVTETADVTVPHEVEVTAPVAPPLEGGVALADENPDPTIVEVHLQAGTVSATLVEDLGPLPLYGYNGQVPGPIIEATVGDRVIVHFENALPEPTTVHWHGLRISDAMDGSPRIQDPVPPGGTFTYDFVVPDAGTFWYHPHVRANEQVEKGLAGMFVVHERARPAVSRERAFVLDDILLDDKGLAPFMADHMEEMHGRSGNVLLTNGHDAPLALTSRQGELERWRIVNVANARTMHVAIEGAKWRVVGTDGGLLGWSYATERLTVAVGQRFDLEVAYDQPGEARLVSYVLMLDDQNNVVDVPVTLANAAVTASDVVAAPATYAGPPLPAFDPVDLEVTLELTGAMGASGLVWTINGMKDGMSGGHEMMLFEAARGANARIVIKNLAGPEHPFHLHGQFFQIVRRNGEDTNAEEGLKDVVLVPGMETVELRAHLDNPGRWMAHCHILEHAELGMMGEFLVTP